MRTFILLTTFAAASVAVPSANADIDVTPSPWSPKIHIDGERKWSPGGKTDAAPISHRSGRDNVPRYESSVPCRIDPVVGNYGCRTPADPAEPAAEAEPEVTPGDVLRAVREIGLPSLRVTVQPGTRTLVNVPTIFYAEPQPFERSVELLGFDVDLVAEPVGYRWDHGDGTVATTDTPGRPYPAMDVVHRYEQPADTVQTRVDVTYRVRFRVDGGAWQSLAQPVVADGPSTALAVAEAAPVLTRP